MTPWPRERLLGEGGMARVWLSSLEDGTPAALKELLTDADEDVARFDREADIIGSIHHANICRIFQRVPGQRALLMELLEGGTLREWMRRARATSGVHIIPEGVIVALMDAMLAALGAAHALGIVHRDLKPSNVMFSGTGVPKLVDFGIAKRATDATLTATQMLVGTPAYMSPEQANGETLDGRSDLFSLGLMLHELVVGESPFFARDPTTSLVRVLNAPIPPLVDVAPWVSERFASLHAGLLNRDKQARFPSADAARAALAPLLREVDTSLLARVHAAPARVKSMHEQHARDLLASATLPLQAAGAWRIFTATHIAPSLPAVMDAQQEASKTFLFGEPDDELRTLVQEAEAQPGAAGIVKRAFEGARARRHLPLQVRFARRYLGLRPQDSVVRSQLDAVIGTSSGARMTMSNAAQPSPALRTADIVRGIKTGGVPGVLTPHDATLRQSATGVSPLQRDFAVPVVLPPPPSFWSQPAIRQAATVTVVLVLLLGCAWMLRALFQVRSDFTDSTTRNDARAEQHAADTVGSRLLTQCTTARAMDAEVACGLVLAAAPMRAVERTAHCARARAWSQLEDERAKDAARACIDLHTGAVDDAEREARRILGLDAR
jgi:tRNA A-37 threonylcarbamoyl transferase component Bud32